MGRLFVASVLMSISNKPESPKTAEVELAPIVPGAWAAWAQNWEAQTITATTAPKPTSTPATLRPAGSEA